MYEVDKSPDPRLIFDPKMCCENCLTATPAPENKPPCPPWSQRWSHPGPHRLVIETRLRGGLESNRIYLRDDDDGGGQAVA
eukprot:9484643-Pyramimonas_sp.AAC.1